MSAEIVIEKETNPDNKTSFRKTVVPAVSYRVTIGYPNHSSPYGYIAYEARAKKVNDCFILEETFDGRSTMEENDDRRFTIIGSAISRRDITKKLVYPIREALRKIQRSTALNIKDTTREMSIATLYPR